MWTQAEVSTLNTQNSLAEKGESSGRKKREAEWEAGGRATSPHAATSSSDPRFLIHTHTPNQPSGCIVLRKLYLSRTEDGIYFI